MAIVGVVLAVACASARADYTNLWVDQVDGRNEPDTTGTVDDPFKSITYALARANYAAWPEPWHLHIRPGVYNADPYKPHLEREIFPIELRQDLIIEGSDPCTCIIDGQHLVQGLTSLLYGLDKTGLRIRNLTLCNMNHSQGNGGAIEMVNCAGEIENCIIRDCNAQSGGGVWLSPCSGTAVPFDFTTCTFINNNAVYGEGGGLYVLAYPDPGALTGDITGCVFTDNEASYGGAGFFVNGDVVGNICDCTFSNNTDGSQGGGFCITGDLDGWVLRCNFESNCSDFYGGGFYIQGSVSGGVDRCDFIDNAAFGTGSFQGGGGFLLGQTINGNINLCTFSGNSAGRFGGGFFVRDILHGDITSCDFVNNSAAGYGGGFSIGGLLQGDILSCGFRDNSAASYGGGFDVATIVGDITSCDFRENNVDYRGGGFYCWNDVNSHISECNFIGNLASSSATGIFVGGSFVGGISDCIFYETGGGRCTDTVINFNNTITGNVKNCEFFSGGGCPPNVAIYMANTLDGAIENCHFLGFGENAIRLLGNTATEAKVRSCLFVSSRTMGEVLGWAVRTSQKTVVCNNTMVGPELGVADSPALYLDFKTEAENGRIYNNIIVDTNEAIHVGAGVDIHVQFNDFYNVDEIVCQGEQCLGNQIWWIEWNLDNFRNNIYADPLFVAYTPKYHIEETSPCVNGGDPDYAVEPNETDIDGQPRVSGGRVDIGADEYHAYVLGADVFSDGIVNFLDFAIIAGYWQQNEPLADIEPPGGDGIVNYLDLKKLTEEWLRTGPWP
jgi:hypothetical protein